MQDAVDGGTEHTADDGDHHDAADYDSDDFDERQTAGRGRQVHICFTHTYTRTHMHNLVMGRRVDVLQISVYHAEKKSEDSKGKTTGHRKLWKKSE